MFIPPLPSPVLDLGPNQANRLRRRLRRQPPPQEARPRGSPTPPSSSSSSPLSSRWTASSSPEISINSSRWIGERDSGPVLLPLSSPFSSTSMPLSFF
ncbi:hypothetical protein RHGRI_011513 [Rhododendron griersonianum]|uniref:Uncharacterized protein n=1 Tax=Rhododendron griersonianum TaxID=479676 RepID=A0AAV6KM93_9ERIC|nr:hypothetical protein RHGRI_011513 [Rhododendron griersonianum]